MPNKILRNNAGIITEINSIDTSTGASDSGKLVETDSNGKIDSSFLPTQDSGISVVTSENLAAGDFVNIYNNAAVATARLADADSSTVSGGIPTKECVGYVTAASTSPAANTVYTEGINDALSGLTIGDRYYLDESSGGTAGGVTSTAPSGGDVVQYLGIAVAADSIIFEPANSIVTVA